MIGTMQAKDPIITQVIEAIKNEAIWKWQLKSEINFDLKSLIRIRKHLKFLKRCFVQKNLIGQ